MTRDAAIRNWNDAAARTIKGENHAVDMLLAAGDALLDAALRSRPAPPDDLVALVQRWQKARLALRDAEDHIAYGMAEQVWEIHERALLTWVAPAPVAAPAPAAHLTLQSAVAVIRLQREAMKNLRLACVDLEDDLPIEGSLMDAAAFAEQAADAALEDAVAAPAPETPAPDAMPEIEFGDDVVWQTKPKPERVAEVICAGSRYEKRMTIHEWREHFRHKQVTAIERNGVVIWRRQEAQP